MRRESYSLRIFRQFIYRMPTGELDVSEVISHECFQAWMGLKRSAGTDADGRKFHRTLTNHIAGTDGRCPFESDEESALLVLLRKKEPWPCFYGMPSLSHLGKQYRSKGYHEKLSTTTTTATVTTVTQASVQPDILNNINEMIFQLRAEDAQYLTNLSGHVVSQFASEFSIENQREVYSLLRFAILGRTQRCCKDAPASHADVLCFDPFDTMTMVLDMTTKSYEHCVLAQNDASRALFGDLVGMCDKSLMWRGELLRMVLAIGGAYHQPGVQFTIRKQEVVAEDGSNDNTTCLWDLTYYVDPESFFLVVYGQQSV